MTSLTILPSVSPAGPLRRGGNCSSARVGTRHACGIAPAAIRRVGPALLAALLIAWTAVPVATGQAAQDPPAVQIGSQSPNAASLGIFGEVPVSLHTGTPSIEIPLFVAEGRVLQVPITLKYHASGVRVGDIAGWVGMGWALDAGGVITRSVRGLPDDDLNGYVTTGHKLYDGVFWESVGMTGVDWDTAPLANYLYSIRQGELDTEPDQFSFNVAGYSGQLILPPSLNQAPVKVRTVPMQPIEILPNNDPTYSGGHIGSWVIRAPDGTEYHFEAMETTTSIPHGVASGGSSYVSGWYLSRIRAAGGDDEILFEYSRRLLSTMSDSYHERRHLLAAMPGCEDFDRNVVSQSIHQTDELLVSRILTARHEVIFHTSYRADVPDFSNSPQQQQLDSISVRDRTSGDFIRGYHFDFNVFGADERSFGGVDRRRSFLTSVREVGLSGSKQPPYRLEYFSPADLPDRRSLARDHWGFYNGADENTTLIPPLDATTYYGRNVFLKGGNREPDTLRTQYGMLSKIVYPTGGWTEFSFQAHDYAKTFEGGLPLVPGPMKEAEAFSSTGSDSTGGTFQEPFQVEGTQPSRVTFTVTWSAPGNNALLTMEARVRDEHGMDLLGPLNGGLTYSADLVPGTYLLEATVDELAGEGWVRIEAEWQGMTTPSAAGTPGAPAGGVRIRKIATYDGSGNPPHVRRYDYRHNSGLREGISSGVLITTPTYDRQFIEQNCELLFRASSVREGLGSSGGSHVGYAEVTEVSDDGRRVSHFRIVPDAHVETHTAVQPPSGGYLAQSMTSQSWQRGQVLREEVFDAAGNLVEEVDHTHFFADRDQDPDLFLDYRGLSLWMTSTLFSSYSKYSVISAFTYLREAATSRHAAGQ
jgi:hypothetical protein